MDTDDDIETIPLKGTTFSFTPIPSNPSWSFAHQGAAASRPFRVKNLEAFVAALTDEHGEPFYGLYIHLIEGPSTMDWGDGEVDTTATVALSGQDGDWSVSLPDVHDSSILGTLEKLGQLVQPHLDEGQVAVFEYVCSVPEDVTLGYVIHAINDKGQTYSKDEQSLVKDILTTLGNKDALRTSDIRLYEAT